MARLPATTTSWGQSWDSGPQCWWNSEAAPPIPQGLSRRPSQPWACLPRQPEAGQVFDHPGKRSDPLQVPFVTPENTASTRRGCHRKEALKPQNWQDPSLLRRLPISPSLDQGQDSWGDQESVNRPAAVGLETLTPPSSVILVRRALAFTQ